MLKGKQVNKTTHELSSRWLFRVNFNSVTGPLWITAMPTVFYVIFRAPKADPSFYIRRRCEIVLQAKRFRSMFDPVLNSILGLVMSKIMAANELCSRNITNVSFNLSCLGVPQQWIQGARIEWPTALVFESWNLACPAFVDTRKICGKNEQVKEKLQSISCLNSCEHPLFLFPFSRLDVAFYWS